MSFAILSGCSSDNNPSTGAGTESDQTTTDSNNTNTNTDIQDVSSSNSGTSCPPSGEVRARVAQGPSNKTIIDANGSDVTENKYIVEALSKAKEANKRGSRNSVHVSVDDIQNSGVEEKIGYANETYIKYSNDIYEIAFYVIEC
ncbi:hypothetical protein [Haloarcula sp. CBA1127]|uniref:hypothetical protein n=1 Tax=Haloarcula sp. CBA1127 TaxID=1765055 RepID=UPI0012ABC30A|nr:hypothetical protein [Haloarcula sp. CBA1127]